VVSIAQDDLCPRSSQLLGRSGLHCALGSHRHERRGLHHAVSGVEYTDAPRALAAGYVQFEADDRLSPFRNAAA
jgi:hypothetical protein